MVILHNSVPMPRKSSRLIPGERFTSSSRDSGEGVWLLDFLKICGLVRGLIKMLILALAKEVRIEVLADWIARSSISRARYSEGA